MSASELARLNALIDATKYSIRCSEVQLMELEDLRDEALAELGICPIRDDRQPLMVELVRSVGK